MEPGLETYADEEMVHFHSTLSCKTRLLDFDSWVGIRGLEQSSHLVDYCLLGNICLV
jgi:hypothetical protein